MDDLTGQQWGNYQLASLLNRGGSADVYVGKHARFKTPATIEIFHVQLADESATVFLNEARALIQLIHPHILRLLDFDIREGHPFFVRDSAPNGSLSQRHPYATRVPLDLVIEYSRQVASALQYAHEQNFVHGEVQPEHMLLSEQNEVMLSDFGGQAISRLFSPAHAQVPAGALAYMAPEQMQGQLLPASDQYALAVTVYQWLCGVWPFQGSPAELVAQHLSRQPLPLRQYAAETSSAVEQVVLRALAKDPAQRFASVQAFAQALEQAGRSANVPVVPEVSLIPPPPPIDSFPTKSAPVATPQPVSRRKFLLAGSATVAGFAAVAGVGVLIAKSRSSQGSQSNAITGSPAGSLVYVYQGQQSMLSSSEYDNSVGILWSADSKRMLSVGGKDGTFQCWDALTGAHIATYQPLLKVGSSTDISGIVQWKQQDPLQLWLDGAVIHLTDIVTNQDIYTVDETTISPGGIERIFWSPGGSLFATMELNYGSQMAPALIRIHKGADGSSISSFHPQYTSLTRDDWIRESAFHLTWSFDSRRILSWGENNVLYIWDTSTGALIFANKKYTQEKQVIDSRGVAWSPDGRYIASVSSNVLDIWKPTNGNIVSTFPLPNSAAFLAWSPDSQMLAIFGHAGLQILVPGARTPLFTHTYNGGLYTAITWSPDSQRLAGNSWVSPFLNTTEGSAANPLFTIFDARTGKHAVNYADSDQQGTSMVRLAWSPDGKYIATQRADSVVEIWRVA